MPVFTLDEARAELGGLLPLLDEMVGAGGSSRAQGLRAPVGGLQRDG
jgi:hypothetical protein